MHCICKAAEAPTEYGQPKIKRNSLKHWIIFLIENELNTKQLILFGDIPALSYLFDMEPAIFTTWIDLDSNQIEQLRIDLDRIVQTQDFQ